MAVNQRTFNLVDKQAKRNLLPQNCILCGEEAGSSLALCSGCIKDLPYNHTACPVCAIPTRITSPCSDCCNDKNQIFDNSRALFVYQYPVAALLKKIKFNNDLVTAKCFGQIFAHHIIEDGDVLPQCIIPVPLHPGRLRLRGYNQAHELARPVAQVLGLPIDIKICKRARPTRPQTDLNAQQRKRNIRNAFSLKTRNSYQHVAIFDDVMTTGATCRELARTLRSSGVKKIDVWVCARASLR